MMIPMNQVINRFNFVRSIKDKDQALYAEKIFNQITFTEEQLGDLKTLHRYASTLHRLDENSCNGHPKMVTEYRDGKMFQYSVEDEAWRARDEKKEFNIQFKIGKIRNKHGWVIETQGDPRGWPISLKVQDIDCSVLVNYR